MGTMGCSQGTGWHWQIDKCDVCRFPSPRSLSFGEKRLVGCKQQVSGAGLESATMTSVRAPVRRDNLALKSLVAPFGLNEPNCSRDATGMKPADWTVQEQPKRKDYIAMISPNIKSAECAEPSSI